MTREVHSQQPMLYLLIMMQTSLSLSKKLTLTWWSCWLIHWINSRCMNQMSSLEDWLKIERCWDTWTWQGNFSWSSYLRVLTLTFWLKLMIRLAFLTKFSTKIFTLNQEKQRAKTVTNVRSSKIEVPLTNSSTGTLKLCHLKVYASSTRSTSGLWLSNSLHLPNGCTDPVLNQGS